MAGTGWENKSIHHPGMQREVLRWVEIRYVSGAAWVAGAWQSSWGTWKEKLTQVKVSSVSQSRERNPLVLGLQNFSQQTWASATPLAKGPAPSYSHLQRHKALALVPSKGPKLCLRLRATFPKVVEAQSCYWGLSLTVSRLFSITVTSQISENVIKMKSSGRQLKSSDN